MANTETLDFVITARDRASAVMRKVAGATDGVRATTERLTKITRDLTGHTDRLTAVEDKHADALGKVRIAEQKLSEVRANANAKTSQIARAEEQLLKARRDAARAAATVAREVEKAATPDGERSGRSFTTGFRRWLTGKGARDLEGAGRFGGSVFGSGFLGMLKTPVLGPVIVGSLLALAATLMPAAGAVLGGALVAGFGAGLAVLGLVFAAKSEAVRRTWRSVLDGMAADLRILSKPFETTLIAWALVARRTFGAIRGELAGAFESLAPALAEFGDQLGRAFERLGPAIRPVSQAFAAVLRSLGPATQAAIGSISAGLIRLSQSIKQNPEALADLVRGFGNLTRELLGILAGLNDANAAFKRLTGVSAVTAALEGLRGVVATLAFPFIALGKGARLAADAIDFVRRHSFVFKGSTDQAAASTTTFSSSLLTTAASMRQMAPPVEDVAAKIARQTANTDRLIGSLNRLTGLALNLSGAQIGLAQAVADATASVRQNGATLDLNTQKGRDNQRALNAVAQAANDQRDAMIRSGKGTDAAGLASLKSRASFVRLAMQMGLSSKAANKMADDMIKIPNVSRTAKLNANKADLDAKLAAAKRQLADPKLTATKRAKLMAEIAQLQAAVVRAKAAINSVRDRTVYINAVVRQRGAIKAADPRLLPPGRASGGPVRAGLPYVVGEKRPELFVPKVSGMILPKVPTATSMGRRGFAGATVSNQFTIYVNGAQDPGRTAEETVRQIAKYVRVNYGGDVQAALGGARA